MVLEDGFVDPIEDLTIENDRLREFIKVIQKKCAAYDAEIKTLLRKIVKLLDEKVENLQIQLRHIANLDGIEQM